ncbi:hypothetical protein [Paenibacillus silviterrae]|uniref:hypothetical protein n=1 Tax=Paenibacillus silviterrae TaxID=3242194 RepID=UPI0032B127D2
MWVIALLYLPDHNKICLVHVDFALHHLAQGIVFLLTGTVLRILARCRDDHHQRLQSLTETGLQNVVDLT